MSDYELPISKAAAKKLMAPLGLPKMGWEMDLYSNVHMRNTHHMDRKSLVIQNVSGTFRLSSFTHPRPMWRDVFGPHCHGLEEYLK